MRRLPTVQIDGLRKVYVRRDDVRRYLDERTFGNDQVPTVSPTVLRSGLLSQEMGGHRVNGPAPTPKG